jgi:hypothetical protein
VPATGALAASASAATITADKACYVNANASLGAPIVITGSGFVPGTTVDLSGVSDLTLVSGVADPAGSISIAAHAPELSIQGPGSGAKTVTATANNPDGSQTIANVHVLAANLAVAPHPSSVRNVRKDKVTYSFSGFLSGKHIYGYWRFKKKAVGKIKFGKAHGPCGTLKQKALLFPGGRPSHDSYKVTFENTSRYSTRAFPRVTGTLSIFHF